MSCLNLNRSTVHLMFKAVKYLYCISCIFTSDAHAKHKAAVFAQPFCLVHVTLVQLEASERLFWELHLFNGAGSGP